MKLYWDIFKMQKLSIQRLIAMIAFSMIIPAANPAHAQALGIENDCAPEIIAHCSTVRPGAGRIVACLVAHEDKISPRCRITAYLASGDLDERLKALRGPAKTCSADILQYCSDVPAGGGRIYDCLKANKSTLTDACRALVPQFQQILGD
jgi:hypothetical protein